MPSPPSPSRPGATTPRLFLFVGGGTGGHIFPTLAVAQKLRARLGDQAHFRFLCSTRPIDTTILAREGVNFTPAPASPPSIRPRALLRFLGGWAPSVRLGREAIGAGRKAGQHVTLIASGGFVAAPLVQAARVEKCPILMLNLDAVPGKANRWIARHATRILTTAPVAQTGWDRIPPIVRQAALTTESPAACRRALGLDPDMPTLLVTGGSQGAASINRFLAAFVRASAPAITGWQVLHQTGGKPDDRDATDVAAAYRQARVPAVVLPFLTDMGRAWGAADLCVCRAGAGNIGEAWATRTPCIFMPYPYHKDAHQRANAMPLVERGAGVLVHDMIEPEANLQEAGTALADLLGSESARAKLKAGLASLGPANGAERVAQVALELW